MRALALSAFIIAAAAVSACQAGYTPESASIPQEAAPVAQDQQTAPTAELPTEPAEATGPPINILKRPR